MKRIDEIANLMRHAIRNGISLDEIKDYILEDLTKEIIKNNKQQHLTQEQARQQAKDFIQKIIEKTGLED